MTLRSDDIPLLDGLSLDLGDAPRVGQLALLALTVGARDRTVEGIQRGVPELTAPGYDATHVMLAEAVAAVSAQAVYRANLVPLMLQMRTYELAGMTRKVASASVVDVYVDNESSLERTWVAGSLVSAGGVVFEVARTVTIPGNAVQVGPVPLVCTARGPQGNIQAYSAQWAPVTPVTLKNITNPQPAQGGALAETDEAYLRRTTAWFGSRGTGSRSQDLDALALNVLGVERTLLLEHVVLRNAARWGQVRWGYADWGAGQFLQERDGAVTLVVRPAGGGYLGTEMLTRLASELEPRRVNGTTLFYASVEEVPVDVRVTARLDGTRSRGNVESLVRQALRAWCNGSTWPWAGTLRESAAEQVVGDVPGLNARDEFAVRLTVDPEGAYGLPDTASGQMTTESFTVREVVDGRVTVVQPLLPNYLFSVRSVTFDWGDELVALT